MYIRATLIRNSHTGERYTTHRLVRSMREGKKVRQCTLLNLGRHFDVPKDEWKSLCQRLEEILGLQAPLIETVYPALVERHAQRIAAQLLARESERVSSPPHNPVGADEPQATHADAPDASPSASSAPASAANAQAEDMQSVDVNSLDLVRPRSVGVEHVALWAMDQVGFVPLLTELGLSGPMRAAVLGSVIGRMAEPGSEQATYRWLCNRSALGELLDVDFETMRSEQLYRASDALYTHREAIERTLFGRVSDLFALRSTVTLYDLTNTYFEGDARRNDKAQRGHSKEKRTDCPLLTLGVVLDGNGFVRHSQVFEGNAVESQTLAEMLEGLRAPTDALVVMDRGIATEANLQWLSEQGYRYLVVSRERHRQIDQDQAVTITTASAQTVKLQKVLSEDGREARLYCYSEQRAETEKGIEQRFSQRFEKGLQAIHDGLSRPRTRRKLSTIHERIGRLKANNAGVAQHYRIEVVADDSGEKAIAIRWERDPKAHTRATHPGVYCLRSNEVSWDEETMWRTYTTLTDLEAVFRSLKSELGLRPIYHQTPQRCEGHLFITVLAYQFVQIIRYRLRQAGISERWGGLRQHLAGQVRVTASFNRADGRRLHVRKTTQAETQQIAIYTALGLDPAPGGVRKMIV